jgi:hypothetical protein
MKKHLFLFAAIILFQFNSTSQYMIWADQMGGASTDYAEGVKVDASGNVYSTGTFQGTADFDPGTGVFNITSYGGPQDIFISKLSSTGAFIWAKRIGGTGGDFSSSIALDAAGNVYITGSFSSTCDFDPSAAVYTVTSQGLQDLFIVKLDPAGNFQWVKTMGTSITEHANSIAIDGAGNIFITGVYGPGTTDLDPSASVASFTSLGAYDVFLAKYNASGTYLWGGSWGSSTNSDGGECVALDAGGNAYVTGYYYSTVDFDPGAGSYTMTSTAGDDVYVTKIDASGNFVWARTVVAGAGGNDRGYGVTIDPSGNVIITGSFSNFPDFDPGPGNVTIGSFGGIDVFVSKLNSAGNYVWAVNLGGTLSECGYDVTTDALGNIYTTGYFSGNPDFMPGAGNYVLICYGVADFFVSKLTPAGTFGWAFQGGGNQDDRGNSIVLDNVASPHICGYFSTNTNFSLPTTYTLNSFGAEDAFVEKLTPCSTAPTIPSAISGSTLICATTTSAYSTNTVASATSYSWTLPGGWTGTSTTPTINITIGPASGIVSITAINPCGSSPVRTLAITVNPVPGTPGSISGPVSLCNTAGSTQYSIATVVGATGYNWTVPAGWTGSSATNIINATPGSSGMFSVAATNSCGAGPLQTLSVSVYTLPGIPGVISGTNTMCENATKTFSVAAVSGATAYAWNLPSGWIGSSTTNIINATASANSGNITVTAINICGTGPAQTKSVTVNPSPTLAISVSNPTPICPPPTNIGGLSMSGSGALSYTWMPGSLTPTNVNIFPQPAGNTTYTLYGTNVNGCVGNTTQFIQVYPLPSLNAGSNSLTCANSTICLNASGSLIIYSWSGPCGYSSGNQADCFPAVAGCGGIFTVGGTDVNGCVNTKTVSVGVSPQPTISASSSTNQLCSGSNATLSGSGGTSYTWAPGGVGASIVISPTSSATYTLDGKDANGCTNTTTITQVVINCPTSVLQLSSGQKELTIYPNPGSGILIVSGAAGKTISVYNVLGVLIHTELPTAATDSKLDITQHPSGIYFVKVGEIIKKIVKE